MSLKTVHLLLTAQIRVYTKYLAIDEKIMCEIKIIILWQSIQLVRRKSK